MHFASLIRQICVCFLLLQCTLLPAVSSNKRVNFHESLMSTDNVIAYIKSFLLKTSSHDNLNERHFASEEYAEDLYSKIGNLMPLETFIKWLRRTKDITDQMENKHSLLPKYGNNLNNPCNPSSAFGHTLRKIIQSWEENKTQIIQELEEWNRISEHLLPPELCNRFKGLTCQNRVAIDPDKDGGKETSEVSPDQATCQCDGDSMNVGFFKPHQNLNSHKQLSHPEGCYVRPWKRCNHLSTVDSYFEDWHSSPEGERNVLAQIIFPVARTHRCMQGTYCFDLIPGMKQPICWCTEESQDEECKISLTNHNHTEQQPFVPPLSSPELIRLRKVFQKRIIPVTETKTPCSPEYNEEIQKLANEAGAEPSKTENLQIMKTLTQRKLHFCDFRHGYICDPKRKTCKSTSNCGPGQVPVGNKGFCLSEIGSQCQSNEDCVEKAKCQYFNEISDSICVCQHGFGAHCSHNKRPFFGGRFLPRVSGFEGAEYIKMQAEAFRALLSWEDAMQKDIGAACNPFFGRDSMEIVNYFGSLKEYDKERGRSLLGKAKQLASEAREGKQLCKYNRFLKCDPIERKCAPMKGNVILPSTKEQEHSFSITVEVDPRGECHPDIPTVFHGHVTFVCQTGYFCGEGTEGKKICFSEECKNIPSSFSPNEECDGYLPGKLKGLGRALSSDETGTGAQIENEEGGEQVLPPNEPEPSTQSPEEGKSGENASSGEKEGSNNKSEDGNRETGSNNEGKSGNEVTPSSPPTDQPSTSAPIGGGGGGEPASSSSVSSITGSSTSEKSPPPVVDPAESNNTSQPPDVSGGQSNITEPGPGEPTPPFEETSPIPQPPSKDFGSDCYDKTDCDLDKYLDCTTTGVSAEDQGDVASHQHSSKCQCVVGLMKVDGFCQIPNDEPCGTTFAEGLSTLSYPVDANNPPICRSGGTCTPINSGTFCRPHKEEGAMFVSHHTLEYLRHTTNGTVDGDDIK